MPSPIPPETRAAVEADLEAENGSTREIAERYGISPASVSRIGAAAGIALDRSKTKNATEAAEADNAAVRAQLSKRFLAEAVSALDALHTEHRAHNFGGKDNTYREKMLPEPPTGDKRNLMIIAATAVDKSMALDRHDSGAGAEQLGSLLGGMFSEMAARHGNPEA